jgi:hypothetical protein
MKALHTYSRTHSVLLGALLLATPSLKATLLVYEGFDYGSSAITNINGTASTAGTGSATGTQGTWTVTNVLPSGGSASSAYQTTGLSFGTNFATSSGGALLQTSKYSGTNAQSVATLQLNTTATGTVWSSYLVNYTNIDLASGGSGQAGLSGTASGASTYFSASLSSNTTVASRVVGARYDATASTGASSLATGTTYLFLSRLTNVGVNLTASITGVMTTWVFTQSGYDTWVTTGGGLESNLNTYAFKVQADSAVTTGIYNLDSTSYLTLKTDAPDSNNSQTIAIYDELRYGTDLTDVTSAIPEPSTYAAIFGALALCGATCRRRRSRNA